MLGMGSLTWSGHTYQIWTILHPVLRIRHTFLDMGWTHISDMDSAASSAEDNPFPGPKPQPAGKFSVNLPTDDWLCRKWTVSGETLKVC